MLASSLRRRSLEAEMLDGPLRADTDLAGNLRDLAMIGRWTGANWLRHRGLRRMLARLPGRTFTVLDVGGGGGDGVAGDLRWAARYRLAGRGVVLDRSEPILRFARDRIRPSIRLVRGDGSYLPFQDKSVDVVTCSLLLHHCSAQQARAVLGEMVRVARRGVIIDDLLRSHAGYLGAMLLGRVCTSNAFTRNDGPLSVRRAFTSGELSALLASTNLQPVWQATIPGYRTVVAARLSSGTSP